jgi:hypothetical protein
VKPRHHLYFDTELTSILEALASRPGSSKSAIVSDALKAYFARHGGGELDEVLRGRLDRMSAQLNRIERDVLVLTESLALFVRFQFTIAPPTPDADQAAARALAQDRYDAFVAQIGRRLASGRTLRKTLAATRDGTGPEISGEPAS